MDSVPIKKSGQLLGIPRIVPFTNEGRDAQAGDKCDVHLLASSEKLSANIQIGIDDSGGIQQGNTNMEWGRVAIVHSEAIEHSCQERNVFGHMLPKPWVIFWPISVVEFDAVAPYNDLTSEIGFRWEESKVLERISIPNPSIISY
jgi:hypothetical protein